jgi:hypothetical protein
LIQGKGSLELDSLFKWIYTSVPKPSIEIKRRSPPKYLAYCIKEGVSVSRTGSG